MVGAQDLDASQPGLQVTWLLSKANCEGRCNQAFQEPTAPCLEVQGPIICKTLKDSRGPRGKKSGGQKSKGRLAKRGPQGLPPYTRRRCSVQFRTEPWVPHPPPEPCRQPPPPVAVWAVGGAP